MTKYCVAFALVLLAGCAGHDAGQPSAQAEPQSQAQPQAPDAQDISSIALQRSPCFGACPVYELTLSADGQVKFVGQRFVDATGERTGVVAPAAFERVAAEVRALDFFALKDRYRLEEDGCTATTTDHSTATFTVAAGGQEKTVSYYYGCMGLAIGPQLDALAKSIDAAGNVAQWIGNRGAGNR